jgi:hypothetical protein
MSRTNDSPVTSSLASFGSAGLFTLPLLSMSHYGKCLVINQPFTQLPYTYGLAAPCVLTSMYNEIVLLGLVICSYHSYNLLMCTGWLSLACFPAHISNCTTRFTIVWASPTIQFADFGLLPAPLGTTDR